MEEKPIFLLLGGNKLNLGILEKFKKKGFRVFVIDWNEKPDLTGDKHYQIDVKDYVSIIDALKKNYFWEYVAFAYSSIDLAVKSVANINRELGLRTITDEGLEYASSKSKMTERWSEAGLLNRVSKCYSSYDEEIERFNSEMKIIIKPDNSASSRGITILEKDSNAKAVKKAFDRAFNEASDHKVVVEEFVEGTEYTVEMIGDSYGNVSVFGISRKSHTKNTDNNKIAVKLHYNSLDDAQQQRIAEFAIKCYKALGFSSSLGHLEILEKADGSFSPVEIGARSSGFIASDLVDIVSGEDFLGRLIDVQKGDVLTPGLHPQTDMSSMYFFYHFPDNSVVVKEKNILDFCNAEISSRYWDRSKIKVGTHFHKIDNDNARLGYEVLEGEKKIMTEKYIDKVESDLHDECLEVIL